MVFHWGIWAPREETYGRLSGEAEQPGLDPAAATRREQRLIPTRFPCRKSLPATSTMLTSVCALPSKTQRANIAFQGQFAGVWTVTKIIVTLTVLLGLAPNIGLVGSLRLWSCDQAEWWLLHQT